MSVTMTAAEREIRIEERGVSQNLKTYWTDVKVKRAWLVAAAALCFLGASAMGVFGFTASLWFLCGAIPLALASGALIWYACSIIDYDDPNELRKVQEQAAKLGLAKIIETHGWGKLFQYSILSPALFKDVYNRHIEPMKLKELIQFYEKAKSELDKIKSQDVFEIPEVKKSKAKLLSETNQLQYTLLKGQFSLQQLINYSLISTDELNQSFIEYANVSPLRGIISEYETVSREIAGKPGFSLPEPLRWKEKLASETNGLKYRDLRNYYSLPRLIQYQLISPDELNRSFIEYANVSPLKEIISEYEAVSLEIAGKPGFSLPEPLRWKEKLASETNGLKYMDWRNYYSLPRLIQYQLISPNELNQSFIEYADVFPLREIISSYEAVSREIAGKPGFSLPEPTQWKAKFVLETKEKGCLFIAKAYSVDKLLHYGIIEQSEYQILHRADQALGQYHTLEQEVNLGLSQGKASAHATCRSTKQLADLTYEANPVHAQLNRLYDDYQRNLKLAESNAATAQKAMLKIQQDLWSRSKCELEISKNRQRQKKAMESQYNSTNAQLKNARNAAKKLRDQSKSIADSQHTSAVHSLEQIADRQIELHRKILVQQCTAIDVDYNKFRSGFVT